MEGFKSFLESQSQISFTSFNNSVYYVDYEGIITINNPFRDDDEDIPFDTSYPITEEDLPGSTLKFIIQEIWDNIESQKISSYNFLKKASEYSDVIKNTMTKDALLNRDYFEYIKFHSGTMSFAGGDNRKVHLKFEMKKHTPESYAKSKKFLVN